MKKFYFIVAFFCLSLVCGQLKAAAGTIDGMVTDTNTGNPISGALIEVNNGNQVRYSTTTAGDGTYSIPGVKKGNYILVTSASGYQTQSVGVSVNNNQTTTVNIALIPNGGTIDGTVTDVSLVPIAGATVEIFQGQTFIATVDTNGSGFYSVPDLAPNNYTVRVTASGFAGQEKGASVQSGVTTTVDFALAINPGAVSGTVTDALLQPIVGAFIEVRNGDTVVGFADTDAGGTYLVPDLAPGNYAVVASADTFQAQSVGATVIASAVTTVDFILTGSPGSISGTVTSAATGLPIPGAAVVVDQNKIIIVSGLTDSNGQYSMTGLAPGNYNVVVDATDFALGAVGATVNANADTVVNFELSGILAILSGTVIDAVTTDPIAGASIEVFDGQILIASALTDPNGGYQLNVPLGHFTVVANANNYQTQATGAIVRISTVTLVNFALVPNPGTIAGTVTDAVTTNPIPGAPVKVFQGTTLIGSALTSANGNYAIANLAPGNYTVVASAADYQTKAVGATVIASTVTTVDFALDPPPGSISGTVTNAANGKPIPGARVIAYQGQVLIASALTDPNGQYSIPDLAPGGYTVIADAINFGFSAVGAMISASSETVVNFALTGIPALISGTVTDAVTTNPIAGASIRVFDGQILIASVLTDPSGGYLVNVPAGNYIVVANANSYQAQADGTTVEIGRIALVNFALVSNPGTIAGTVTDAVTTNPIPGASVKIFQGTTLIDSALTDVNGNYIIANLAPGNYFVVATADGYQTAFSSQIVTAGATTIADFALNAPAGAISGTITDACVGNPVSGALVVVTDGSVIVGFILSDANGFYTIPDLAAGTYTVTVGKRNFLTSSSSATVVVSETTEVDLILTPAALPPESISGAALPNRYLTQTDYVHEISWSASPGLCVADYLVYRNGTQIAVVPFRTLKYVDFKYTKKAATYSVVARNIFGQLSVSLSIIFK